MYFLFSEEEEYHYCKHCKTNLKPENIISHFERVHPKLIVDKIYKSSIYMRNRNNEEFILNHEKNHFLVEISHEEINIYHRVSSINNIDWQAFQFVVIYINKKNKKNTKFVHPIVSLKKKFEKKNCIKIDITSLIQDIGTSDTFNFILRVELLCSSCKMAIDSKTVSKSKKDMVLCKSCYNHLYKNLSN